MTALNYLGLICAIVASVDMVAALVLAMRERVGASILLSFNFLILGMLVQLRFFG